MPVPFAVTAAIHPLRQAHLAAAAASSLAGVRIGGEPLGLMAIAVVLGNQFTSRRVAA